MKTTIAKILTTAVLSLGGLGATQIIKDNQTVSTNTSNEVTITQNQSITLDQAKEIALNEVNGTVQRTEEDNDDYTIYIEKDNYIYEVEISKLTGQVESIEKEEVVTSSITLDQAKEIALKEVDGTFQNSKEDNDEYTIYIEKDNYLYEVDVDKLTGQVDSIDKELNEVKITTESITLEKAKEIALQKVNGTVQRTEEDNDDYTIYVQKDNYIYEIEVNKISGAIEDVDKEAVKSTTNNTTTKKKNTSNTTSTITLDEAKEIALQKVNGTVKTTAEDKDEYTIFIQKDNYIYEIEVNKKTGKIEDMDKERVKSSTTSTITVEKAKEIALNKVNGTVKEVDYDSEDNEYEVKVIKNNTEYEIKIDGASGKVLKTEIDD